MQPALTIITLSLWLIVFLSVTCVVYALVSMWKENRFGWALRGIIWFTMAIICLCAIVFLGDHLEKTRALETISRRVEAIILGL